MAKSHLQDFVVNSKKELLKKLLFCALITIQPFALANNNQTLKGFINHAFNGESPKPKRIWIDKQNQEIIKKQFNPSQVNLSYRYWENKEQTVWILDEIGKEQNITTGIVIQNNAVKKVEVLIYRESRGGQVQNQRFTQQYYQKHSQSNFIKEIDSISGATLSVNALNKQVSLALWLNSIK